MGWKRLHHSGGKGCHNCRHAGRYIGIPYRETPCAGCDGGAEAMIQGHGRIESWGTGANLGDVPAAAVEVEAGADRPAADGDALARAVRRTVYGVALLTLGEVVTVWNHVRGGSLADAGALLGVTKQRCNTLLHSGLARLGVADVWTVDNPARRKLFAIQRAARRAVQERETKKPAPRLAVEVRGEATGENVETGQLDKTER